MRLVSLETPFAHRLGDAERFRFVLRYVRAAMRDCLFRGEAPFASHALYPQPGVLDEHSADHRALGIEAGLAWKARADATVVYVDLGISDGMAAGIIAGERIGHRIEYRTLEGWNG